MSQDQSLLEALKEEEAVTQVAEMDTQDAKETSEISQQSTLKWLKPFIEDKINGLEAFVAELSLKTAPDVVLEFRNALEDVIEAHKKTKAFNPNAPVFPNQIEFLEEFEKLALLRKNCEATHADMEKQNTIVEWLLQKFFTEIYYIAQYTFPSMYFCGSVEPELMAEDAEFFGYNERQVHLPTFVFLKKNYRKSISHPLAMCRPFSYQKAMTLMEDIMYGYRGIGAESIFLMFKEPCGNYADAIHKGKICGTVTPHTPAQLVECFLKTDYGSKAHVP